MNTQPFADQEGFGAGPNPSFIYRVRETVYLWGSASLKADANFGHPPIIHIRNAKHGDAVTIETVTAAGGSTQIGSLDPGETISLELQGISGITATCNTQSVVYCTIR